MADRHQFSSALGLPSAFSKSLDGESEEPPSYTAATQHTQYLQEGPEDLSLYLNQSPKVLRYKLEEPQVPATPRKLEQLLDGDNIVKIYSCYPGRQDIAIAEAERDLFEYFSGNVIDWTNTTLGVCDDSVSTYLVDWMKAGGKIPTEGPSVVAYREKDLEWLEQLYTIAGNVWMRKLMKQTAKEIDRFTGDNKKMQSLVAERKKRDSVIKEAVKQQSRASKEADGQLWWLAKNLTKEQKRSMHFNSLDPHDENARLLIAETHQREKGEKRLRKQQKEADKKMAKQRKQMEKALTEQFRKDTSAALMLGCKRMLGKLGDFAFKLVESGLVVGAMGACLTAWLIWWVGKIALALVISPFTLSAGFVYLLWKIIH